MMIEDDGGERRIKDIYDSLYARTSTLEKILSEDLTRLEKNLTRKIGIIAFWLIISLTLIVLVYVLVLASMGGFI